MQDFVIKLSAPLHLFVLELAALLLHKQWGRHRSKLTPCSIRSQQQPLPGGCPPPAEPPALPGGPTSPGRLLRASAEVYAKRRWVQQFDEKEQVSGSPSPERRAVLRAHMGLAMLPDSHTSKRAPLCLLPSCPAFSCSPGSESRWCLVWFFFFFFFLTWVFLSFRPSLSGLVGACYRRWCLWVQAGGGRAGRRFRPQ